MRLFTILAVLVFSITSCQSRQARVDSLQKEYDAAEARFRKDCNAEFLKVRPTLDAKCVEEDRKTKDAWNRLQAERAKP
jgi:hypothetical protein